MTEDYHRVWPRTFGVTNEHFDRPATDRVRELEAGDRHNFVRTSVRPRDVTCEH